MSDGTGIEWTDATWNPIRGCSRVSEGCRNCYAESMANRYSGPGLPYEGLAANGKWTGEVRVVETHIEDPLRWKKPRKIFVNSMSDLFHDGLRDEDIAEVFGVMALANQHIFQVLTKRPKRMSKLLNDVMFWARVEGVAQRREHERTGEDPSLSLAVHGPLPNVWLGVSVENQASADERIPWLLGTPAAVRFLSCEPLLGPVDLTGWGNDAPARDYDSAPTTWKEYTWPDWVPAEQRKQIESFWSESWGGGPRAWLRDHVIQQVPATGARGIWTVRDSNWAEVNKMATVGASGRYLHSWNNMGRIITDDGRTITASGGSGSGWLNRWRTRDGRYASKLHWVIAGGESGPGARPMHRQWASSLRDQCAAAGVPYFFKQNGEWLDCGPKEDLEGSGYKPKDPAERWVNLAGGHGYHGEQVRLMKRVGKKAAGSLLDGAEHKSFPGAQHAGK